MIAAWMLYTLLVGLCVGLAAWAAERALLLLGRPVRGVWGVALALSLLIPCLAHFFPTIVSAPAPVERVMLRARDAVAPPAATPGSGMPTTPQIPVDRVLLVGWAAASFGLGQMILWALAVLHGRRREWRRGTVDGVEALIAPDFGPAVIGWRRLTIVLPEWTLALPEDARALVVRHEREHLEQRDPRLLLHASLIVLAMPWNPAVWWQLRRLRRAIEIDCDARVVRSGADVARYGEILLEASGFNGLGGLPAMAAFAERATDLEARINALTRRPPAWRRLRVAAAGSTALLLGAAACIMPDPLSPRTELALVVSQNPANFQELREWVQHHVTERLGRDPVGTVVLVRASTGQIVAVEEAPTRGPGGWNLDRGSLLAGLGNKDIASIEVIKGKALEITGLEGLVVISLKPGVVLRSGPGGEGRINGVPGDTVRTLGYHVREYGRARVYLAGRILAPYPIRDR